MAYALRRRLLPWVIELGGERECEGKIIVSARPEKPASGSRRNGESKVFQFLRILQNFCKIVCSILCFRFLVASQYIGAILQTTQLLETPNFIGRYEHKLVERSHFVQSVQAYGEAKKKGYSRIAESATCLHDVCDVFPRFKV